MNWGDGLNKKKKMSRAPAVITLLPVHELNVTGYLTLLPPHLPHHGGRCPLKTSK